jgi:hypothetical protein
VLDCAEADSWLNLLNLLSFIQQHVLASKRAATAGIGNDIKPSSPNGTCRSTRSAIAMRFFDYYTASPAITKSGSDGSP